MAKIEGFRIKNFGSLKDVILGKLGNQQKSKPLTPLTAVIGKNGVRKSTIFDAFGFLSDCLKFGVEEACDKQGRGGYERLFSKGQEGKKGLGYGICVFSLPENLHQIFTTILPHLYIHSP